MSGGHVLEACRNGWLGHALNSNDRHLPELKWINFAKHHQIVDQYLDMSTLFFSFKLADIKVALNHIFHVQ